MRDVTPLDRARPIGIFVHHQGRGHIERAAALANALPQQRKVVLFCAKPDTFPALRDGVEVVRLPSLFEPSGSEVGNTDWIPTPDVFHCAPVGWPGIRKAMATLATWFETVDPALFISDVSAELAMFARICSVPHVMVLQHGDRRDPGHQAAYTSAVGLLAPYHRTLAQPDWSDKMLEKTCFAGGLGIDTQLPTREEARAKLGISTATPLVLTVSGGGGGGIQEAPLAVGARSAPQMQWVTIGPVQRDWHATAPFNLRHMGWVEDPMVWISAADFVVSSTGNTTCHQILAAGKPWLAVPEWRYFDEQKEKAKALARARVATCRDQLPGSAQAWRLAIHDALSIHNSSAMRSLSLPSRAHVAARWIEQLIARLWPVDTTAPALEGTKL